MKKSITSRDLNLSFSLLSFLTPARLRILREHYDPIESVTSADAGQLAFLLRVPEDRAKLVINPLQIVDVFNTVTEIRDDAIVIDDLTYPPLLRQIPDPPPAIFCRGRRELLSQPAVAIVGSRTASRYGLAVAERLGRELSSLGVTVISGLARGIDQAAHRGALEADGSTIAVLGTGIDVDYPRGSRSLRTRISSDGLMLTEFPPGVPPRPAHFPIRNRIISGLSLGVVVVEATDRSGSLITARLAAEQNREVFAVPGSVFGKGSEGPHRLIQYGAKLVHDVDDILEELSVSVRSDERRQELTAPAEELSAKGLDLLEIDEPSHVDLIAAKLDVGVTSLSRSLLELEMAGRIRPVPGGRWVKAP
ncbi:MAG: DNA-processing protein DprA [Acidobacteria bacterium]|nr:DNA-processing protein DprA [Acidobacteriota bacterium]